MVAAESLFREILYCMRRWYMYSKLHGVTSQKKAVGTVTATRDIILTTGIWLWRLDLSET
jgi:hypothetical protein